MGLKAIFGGVFVGRMGVGYEKNRNLTFINGGGGRIQNYLYNFAHIRELFVDFLYKIYCD